MAKGWDQVKTEIHKLYIVQNKTLAEVIRLMKGNHDFIASERSYRTQLRDWGYLKNNTRTFQSSRVKKRRKTRVERLVGIPTTEVPIAPQFNSFGHSSAPIPSQSYLHGTESWQFGAAPESSTGATSHQYQAFGQHLNDINLPSISGSEFSLNTQDADGRTQLHRATINGMEEAVKNLLAAGAAVDIEDNVHNQPLHYAVLGCSVSIVKLLLRFGADPDCKGQAGKYPLHLSISSKKTLKVLLESPATTSPQDDKGDTPLHMALGLSERELVYGTVELLLNAGAHVNVVNLAGVTPFHLFLNDSRQSKYEYYSLLNNFLDHGADLALPAPDNKLPFETFLEKSFDAWAISGYSSRYSGDSTNSCLKLFLSKGADPNTRLRSGELIFHHYIQKDYLRDDDIMDLMCGMVDPRMVGGNGNYLLHELSTRAIPRLRKKFIPFPNLLKIAIDRGADPNKLNRSGLSPLMMLLNTKKNVPIVVLEGVEVLLARGANPTIGDPSGNFPLYEALRNFPEVADDLGKKLLHASIDFGSNNSEDGNNGSGVAEGSSWWQKWELTYSKIDWDRAKTWLDSPQNELPADVSKQVCSMALHVLAEKHLEYSMGEAKPDSATVDEHRLYVARILKDCRQFDLVMDRKWFEYLLDLS